MLTAAQIQAADPFLTEIAINQLLTLIRSLPRYTNNPGLYPNLETKLRSLKQGVVSAADEVKAQIANAALAKIEAVGPGQTALDGGREGVRWSKAANREEFIEDALNALYEVPAARSSSAVVPMKSGIVICSLHHVNFSLCGCTRTALVF